MTAPTAAAPAASRDDQRVTQARVIRSEWTKLRTLPSSAWSLLAAAVLIVGFGALYAGVRVTRPPQDPAAIAGFDPPRSASAASAWPSSPSACSGP